LTGGNDGGAAAFHRNGKKEEADRLPSCGAGDGGRCQAGCCDGGGCDDGGSCNCRRADRLSCLDVR
jgi:hypothetical protein